VNYRIETKISCPGDSSRNSKRKKRSSEDSNAL
jgi:hypothetical protein